ncbi:MAG: hypothetical protein ACOCWM_02045 [Cyclobacteriaceae bacterium]
MASKTGLAASLKQKKDIDLSVLQKNVEQLHPKEEKKKTSILDDEDLQKFQVFLPKEVHKKIKLYCTANDVAIKDFCADAIMSKAQKLDIL